MWEFVDKIIYINLDHREDRRKIMEKFFEEGKIPHDKISRFSAIVDNPGSIGCSKSHIAVIKLAKANNWNSVLVLEDDLEWVNFEENYKKLETLISTETWDVCLLGGNYIKTDNSKAYMSMLTSSYLVKSHYYDTLLNNFETGLEKKLKTVPRSFLSFLNKKSRIIFLKETYNEFNIDIYWMKLQLKDNWICMIEPMCKQIVSYSDVTDVIKDRNEKIQYNDYFREIEQKFQNDLL